MILLSRYVEIALMTGVDDWTVRHVADWYLDVRLRYWITAGRYFLTGELIDVPVTCGTALARQPLTVLPSH